MLQYINIVILHGTNQFAVHDISHMKNGHNSRKIISIMWTSTPISGVVSLASDKELLCGR